MERRSWACVSTWRGAQEEICKQWPKTATLVAAASPGWDWHVWYWLAWHDFRRAVASLYGGWQMHWSRQTDGQTGANTGKTLLTAALGLGVTTSLTSPLTTSSCPLLYPLHPPSLDPTGCQTLSPIPPLPWQHWFAHFISEKSALTSELSPTWHMSKLCCNDYPFKFSLTFWLEPYVFCCHVWLVITSLYLTCRRCSINACWGTHLAPSLFQPWTQDAPLKLQSGGGEHKFCSHTREQFNLSVPCFLIWKVGVVLMPCDMKSNMKVIWRVNVLLPRQYLAQSLAKYILWPAMSLSHVSLWPQGL